MIGLMICAALASAHDGEAGARDIAIYRAARLRTNLPVAAWRVSDLTGSGRDEILVIGDGGQVRQWREADGEGFAAAPEGRLTIAQGDRALLSLSRFEGEEGPFELFLVNPRGVQVFPLEADGLFASEPRPVASRARFELRTGHPVFSPFVQDVDNDGRNDLVLPAGEELELWLQGEPRESERTFARAARVAVDVNRWRWAETESLTGSLVSSFTIPNLRSRDVNGDERPDLRVSEDDRYAWHIQRDEGGFPRDPDVELDLSIFRDTTPEASGLRPGRTLVLEDGAEMQSSDLDGDGITDYVIAHRRKVWVFHGTPNGPQFRDPTTILKTAEDVTELTLVDLDQDERSDLLIIKVDIPTVTALVLGMFSTWDIDITLVGYRNKDGQKFEIAPTWNRTLTMRLPSLFEIMSKPEKLIERFEGVERKFRTSIRSDFDGDGAVDVALVGEDGTELELWLGSDDWAVGEESDGEAGEQLKRLVFDDEDSIWDIDRILAFMTETGERRTARLTGERPPDGRLVLGEGTGLPLVRSLSADTNGDGRAEIVMVYEGPGRRVVFELLRVR